MLGAKAPRKGNPSDRVTLRHLDQFRRRLGQQLWRGVDQGVIDGLVNGAGSASQGVGDELRRMQSGNIRSYAAWVAIGAAAILGYMIWLGVSR